MPVRLMQCIVCPSHSIPGFPVKIPAWMAVLSGAGMHRFCCDTLAVLPVGTGLRSLRASPFGEEGYKQGVTV